MIEVDYELNYICVHPVICKLYPKYRLLANLVHTKEGKGRG